MATLTRRSVFSAFLLLSAVAYVSDHLSVLCGLSLTAVFPVVLGGSGTVH